MDLTVSFSRMPYEGRVIETPPEAMALLRQPIRDYVSDLRSRDPLSRDRARASGAEWQAMRTHLRSVGVHSGVSTAAVWVLLLPMQPPAEIPALEEVARLLDGSTMEWVAFLRRYGVPRRNRRWVVARVARYGCELWRVPMEDLDQLARDASDLIKARDALVADPDAWNRAWGAAAILFEVSDTREMADTTMRSALRDALDELEPVVSPTPRGITDDWGFYAWGWWPLAITKEFVHRVRYSSRQRCVAPGCHRELPPRRRKYCSKTCYWRAAKRRQRDRNHGGHV